MKSSSSDAPREEAVFRWVRIYSQDELAKFYADVMANIRKEAEYHGYAIGLHGSMRRDLDLIAVPWKNDHADKDELARAVQVAALGPEQERFNWTPKPCGRWATSLPICWLEYKDDRPSAGCIDLSVMPAIAATPPSSEDALRNTKAGDWLPLLEIFAPGRVLLHGAAGEDAMNVGDVVALVRKLAKHQSVHNDTPATYWLIERNSKHKGLPPNEPVMWFRERKCFAQGDIDQWTPHAHKAMHFPTKEAAEEYLKENFGGDSYDPLPDVTEHMDCQGPVQSESVKPDTAKVPEKDIRRALEARQDATDAARRLQEDGAGEAATNTILEALRLLDTVVVRLAPSPSGVEESK